MRFGKSCHDCAHIPSYESLEDVQTWNRESEGNVDISAPGETDCVVSVITSNIGLPSLAVWFAEFYAPIGFSTCVAFPGKSEWGSEIYIIMLNNIFNPSMLFSFPIDLSKTALQPSRFCVSCARRKYSPTSRYRQGFEHRKTRTSASRPRHNVVPTMEQLRAPFARKNISTL